MRQFRHCVSLTLVAAAWWVSAQSALACGPYRVGVKEYPAIYERRPGEREYRGLDKDFYALLAERSGCQFQLELDSQPRVWAAMRSGRLDITGWAVPTPERQAHVVMIPLASARLLTLTWADQGIADAATFLAQPQRRAIVVRGSSYGPQYDVLLGRLREQGRLIEVAEVEVALRMFFARRADLVIAYPWAAAAGLRGVGEAVRLADWYAQAPGLLSGLALSKRSVSEADQRRILSALQGMQRDGSLARLVHHHLPAIGVQVKTRIAPLEEPAAR